MAKHFNVTQMVLFLQTLPSSIKFPPGVPLQVKIGIVLATAMALIISSYISRRSQLQKKVVLLDATVAELEKMVAALNHKVCEMQRLSVDVDAKISVVEQCTDFLFTNHTHVQKALYKKLDLEEKYKTGKKEPYLTKNRQQAIQEYEAAKMAVARRFNEV